MALTKISGNVVQQNNFSVGVITSTNINASGVITATSFSGSDINLTGVITATSFVGDISQATGAQAGLGTALSSNQDSPLNKIYYVDNTLNITSNTTISVPGSATLSDAGFRVAYTNYADIHIQDSYDLIISSGSELAMDVLSLV